MKFFKNIFKSKSENLPINQIEENSSQVSSATQENNIVENQQVRIDQILNRSISLTLTETQKSELIEQLANENDSLDNFKNKINDPMLEMAAMAIVKNQSGSTSLIQRRFNLGYNRAGRVMDSLEKLGIVGASIGGRPRDVLIKTEEQLQSFLKTGMIYSKIDIDGFYQENKTVIDTRKLEIKQQAIDAQLKYEKNLIRASLLEQERKKNLHLEVYRELIEEGHIKRQISGNDSSRESIPQDVMDSVWNRDSGKCVKCGGQESLEFDHIIPFSKGGANTYRNLQILCKKCNIEKSNKIG